MTTAKRYVYVWKYKQVAEVVVVQDGGRWWLCKFKQGPIRDWYAEEYWYRTIHRNHCSSLKLGRLLM